MKQSKTGQAAACPVFDCIYTRRRRSTQLGKVGQDLRPFGVRHALKCLDMENVLCRARFILDNKVGGYRCRSQVPEHEILKIVRMYAPIITEFFDNEEEIAKFQK